MQKWSGRYNEQIGLVLKLGLNIFTGGFRGVTEVAPPSLEIYWNKKIVFNSIKVILKVCNFLLYLNF